MIPVQAVSLNRISFQILHHSYCCPRDSRVAYNFSWSMHCKTEVLLAPELISSWVLPGIQYSRRTAIWYLILILDWYVETYFHVYMSVYSLTFSQQHRILDLRLPDDMLQPVNPFLRSCYQLTLLPLLGAGDGLLMCLCLDFFNEISPVSKQVFEFQYCLLM